MSVMPDDDNGKITSERTVLIISFSCHSFVASKEMYINWLHVKQDE
jgi:hypothetical protein